MASCGLLIAAPRLPTQNPIVSSSSGSGASSRSWIGMGGRSSGLRIAGRRSLAGVRPFWFLVTCGEFYAKSIVCRYLNRTSLTHAAQVELVAPKDFTPLTRGRAATIRPFAFVRFMDWFVPFEPAWNSFPVRVFLLPSQSVLGPPGSQ